jgi:phosphoglycolate phosphatase-like HAD superfamily hydrolase
MFAVPALDIAVPPAIMSSFRRNAMDLDDYHYHDGRPVSFDRKKVIHLEPHESGSGTFVRLAYEGGSHAMHLQEDYEFLKQRFAETSWDRAIEGAKDLLNDREAAGIPF